MKHASWQKVESPHQDYQVPEPGLCQLMFLAIPLLSTVVVTALELYLVAAAVQGSCHLSGGSATRASLKPTESLGLNEPAAEVPPQDVEHLLWQMMQQGR